MNIMLAKAAKAEALENFPYPALVQTKIDGCRILIYKQQLYTRKGNRLHIPVEGMLDSHVYDGELIWKDGEGNTYDRKSSNGLSLRTQSRGLDYKHLNAHPHILLWDMLTFEEYDMMYSKRGYADRLHELNQWATAGWLHTVNVFVLPAIRVNSPAEVQAAYEAELARGGEGVVVKTINGPWECKRSSHWLKLKAEKTAELQVIGMEQGTNRLRYTMGSLLCSDASGKVVVSVGGGFSDEERDWWWRNYESLCDPRNAEGKPIIEVKYNEIISKKYSDTKSLYLPRYVRHRFDKTKADTLA